MKSKQTLASFFNSACRELVSLLKVDFALSSSSDISKKSPAAFAALALPRCLLDRFMGFVSSSSSETTITSSGWRWILWRFLGRWTRGGSVWTGSFDDDARVVGIY